MPRFDLDLDELRAYRPDVREPDDFDGFWRETLAEARAAGGDVVVRPHPTPFVTLDVFDIRFPGFAGDPVSGWLTVPRGSTAPLPVIVEYNGYGGGRGLPVERIGWASAGYAHFFMDTRGQGSLWGTGGDTPDPHGSGPAASGVMTRGIEAPESYYYRRVFTDAVRAIDALRTLDVIDGARVAVCGGSQGGGIALAAAALSDGVRAAMPEVPFLCHFERAVGMTAVDPYQEVVRYLAVHRDRVEQVFDTLSYFDGVAMAKRASAAALFSVGLMDTTCPPSTVFAAFNHYAGSEKRIEVYPFNDHEGGQSVHWLAQVDFAAAHV